MLKKILLTAVVAFAIGAIGMPAVATPSDLVGSAAPGFELPDYNGNTVSLADFSGKLTMLVFWFPT